MTSKSTPSRYGAVAVSLHWISVLLIIVLLGLAACVDATGGPPTGATCPPDGTTLTYDSFGAPFMATYCTRCHATTLRGADRQGAPLIRTWLPWHPAVHPTFPAR